MDSTLTEYFTALAGADPVEALAVLEKAYQAGEERPDLVRNVIAAAQHTVGERWLEGLWGVADEHAATSVAEEVLAMFAPPEAAPDADQVVWMACAEGEWHTFPPRLAAALARGPRLRLIALGGSISDEHLQRYLSKSQPDALALSATMPVNLVGAARSIRAARSAGVPVVVGGAAWGGDQRRATKLGAQVFVSDPADLSAAVDGLSPHSGIGDLPTIPVEVALLERPPVELLRRALDQQREASVWMQRLNSRHEQRMLEDLEWMARHAAAAVLCDDETIVQDSFEWLLTLLTPQGVPGRVVLDSALYLADAVDGLAPRAAELLNSQALAAQVATSPVPVIARDRAAMSA